MADIPKPRLLLPSLTAGPTVLLLLAPSYYVAQIPHPIELHGSEIVPLLFLIPMSMLIGIVPAMVCNALGTIVMIRIGQMFPLLRFPFVWAVAGGLVAWVVVRWFELPGEWVFAFTGAGAVSALLCRMRLA